MLSIGKKSTKYFQCTDSTRCRIKWSGKVVAGSGPAGLPNPDNKGSIPAVYANHHDFKTTHFKTDKTQRTNIPGIFAAGDICGPPWQVAKAVGEGCVAGLNAADYAKKVRIDSVIDSAVNQNE
jgi:succinate dehydrogenase/fumarate reductase flavoprotein subunit